MEQIQRIKCGNGNAYIISNGENAVLVDTGRTSYRQKVLDACKPYKIRLLILTHGHIDHIENAQFLVKHLNVPIAICKEDINLLESNLNQELYAHSLLGKLVLRLSIKTFKEDLLPIITPTVFLKEGDSLKEYGISANIIELPGHTNGSIGIEVAGKYLIVGDALMNMFYPTVSMLYHEKAVMLKSAERISNMGELEIYFGHGKMVKNRKW